MKTGAPTSVLVKHTTMDRLELHAGSDFDRETANTPDGGRLHGGGASPFHEAPLLLVFSRPQLVRPFRGHYVVRLHPFAGHCSQAAQRGGPFRRNAGGSGPPHREDSSRRHNSTVAPARDAGGSGDGSAVAPARDDISGTPPVTGDPVPTASSQSAPVAVRTTTASQTNPEDALPCRPPTGSPVVPSIEDVPPLTDGEGLQRQLTTTQRHLDQVGEWQAYAMGLLSYLAHWQQRYQAWLQQIHIRSQEENRRRAEELEARLADNSRQQRAIDVLRSALITLEAPPIQSGMRHRIERDLPGLCRHIIAEELHRGAKPTAATKDCSVRNIFHICSNAGEGRVD